MNKKGFLFLLALILFSTVGGFAKPAQKNVPMRIYVNQTRFYGSYFVRNHKIYVRAASFKNALYLPSNYSFPERIQIMNQGNSYIDLRAYARENRDTVMTNWNTGIINLFTVPLSTNSYSAGYMGGTSFPSGYYSSPLQQSYVSGYMPQGYGSGYQVYVPGPTIVVPPASSADSSWCLEHMCSPITHRPEAALPPPALTLEPLVGNPWYNYPRYAPDPYYTQYNPTMYNPYGYYNGYGGYNNGYFGGQPFGGTIYP
jgi:hypothetical protein